MKNSKLIIFLLCGIVFATAAFPVFAQNDASKEAGRLNKRPFEDLADSITEKLAKNEIDLNKPFLVVLDGTLTEDGRLDKKNSKFIKSEGDEQMIRMAKDAITALGDSGFLAYLKNYGIDKINLTLQQDDTQLQFILVSEQKDENKANTMASGFNTLRLGLITADRNNNIKLDDGTRLLLDNMRVTADGNNFVLNVAIPKADAQEMINKSLKDRAEKKARQLND